MNDRERLRATFELASERYHRARPDCPAGLYTDLLDVTALSRDDKLSEIGCGTGIATAPLAKMSTCRSIFRPGQLPEYSDEIQSSGVFGVLLVNHFD